MNTAVERRGSARHRVYMAATIEFNRAAGVGCVVRNLSETGACIEVESQTGIPDSFNLVMTRDGSSHRCGVRWRSVTRLGIAFDH